MPTEITFRSPEYGETERLDTISQFQSYMDTYINIIGGTRESIPSLQRGYWAKLGPSLDIQRLVLVSNIRVLDEGGPLHTPEWATHVFVARDPSDRMIVQTQRNAIPDPAWVQNNTYTDRAYYNIFMQSQQHNTNWFDIETPPMQNEQF